MTRTDARSQFWHPGQLLRQLSDATRSIAIECMTAETRSIAGKLLRHSIPGEKHRPAGGQP